MVLQNQKINSRVAFSKKVTLPLCKSVVRNGLLSGFTSYKIQNGYKMRQFNIFISFLWLLKLYFRTKIIPFYFLASFMHKMKPAVASRIGVFKRTPLYVPYILYENNKYNIVLKWIFNEIEGRKERSPVIRLFALMLSALHGRGRVVEMRKETHIRALRDRKRLRRRRHSSELLSIVLPEVAVLLRKHPVQRSWNKWYMRRNRSTYKKLFLAGKISGVVKKRCLVKQNFLYKYAQKLRFSGKRISKKIERFNPLVYAQNKFARFKIKQKPMVNLTDIKMLNLRESFINYYNARRDYLRVFICNRKSMSMCGAVKSKVILTKDLSKLLRRIDTWSVLFARKMKKTKYVEKLAKDRRVASNKHEIFLNGNKRKFKNKFFNNVAFPFKKISNAKFVVKPLSGYNITNLKK